MEFINCNVGWPGSVHDARVYSNSDLGKKIENKPMDLFPGETFLIGN